MKNKTLIISTCYMLLSATTVFAVWSDEFASLYYEKGIDEAVIFALQEGANPEEIIKIALPLKDLKKENLMKALFCALPQPDTIKEAATKNGVTEEKVNEGFNLALSECARQMDENLNAALDSSQRFPGSSTSSNEARIPNYASPWRFEK